MGVPLIFHYLFWGGALCKLVQAQPLCQVTQAMVDECCEARRGLEIACEPLKGKKAKKAWGIYRVFVSLQSFDI